MNTPTPTARVRVINVTPPPKTRAESVAMAHKAIQARVARDQASFLVHYEACAAIPVLACKKQNIDRATFHVWRANNPEFAARCHEIEEGQLDLVEARLLKHIHGGNVTATIFYLKTKGKKRGYVERHEHTGLEGASLGPAIYINDLKKEITPGSLKKILEQLTELDETKNERFPNRDNNGGAKPFSERENPVRFSRSSLSQRVN